MSIDTIKSEVDEQKVTEYLKHITLPPEIERYETRFGHDSTNDPAAWITFHVKPEVKVGTVELDKLERFLSEVDTALLQADIAGFPYTLLEQAA